MATIYEGTNPFVFISYAHKDTARVMPIIEALVSKGVRIWYDAGIEAGSEWPEYIASHLKTCACTLCFISQNYDTSDNCRRELTYALNCKRPTMSVYLEQCQLSDGLELQLGLVQAVFCNRFPTVDLLADNLTTVPMVAACLTDVDGMNTKPIPMQQTAIPPRNEAAEALFRQNATIKDGVLEKYCGNETNVCIPYDITSIGKQAFYFCKNLTSVIVPDSVVHIDEHAFAYCEALTSVTIPASVKSIGQGAFAGCKALTAVTIPKSLTNIEEWCFAFCESLTTLSIPDGVTNIGRFAFSNCYRLASVIIPDTVVSINRDAFENCKALSSVNIPSNIVNMDYNPFIGCNKLTQITVSPNNPYFVVRNGHLINTHTKTLVVGCADTPIPDDGSVASIGKYAFSLCNAITSIVIPQGVTHINNNSFYSCNALTSATLSDSVISIGDYAFSSNKVLAYVNIPPSVTTIGSGAFSHCPALTSVTIPGSVSRIQANPFSECNNLTEIVVSADNPYFVVRSGHLINTYTKTLVAGCPDAPIPSDGSVTKIGKSAYAGCNALTSVSIPNGITSIGAWAFSSCKNLTSVTIPNGVISIEERLFSCCDALSSVYVPDSVTTIAPATFDGCKKVTIYTPKNSFAWKWAQNNHLSVQDDAIIKQDFYQSIGLCRYCGGKFKGLFHKKCISCGKPKDY